MDKYAMVVLVFGFVLFGLFGLASATLFLLGWPGPAICLKIAIGAFIIANLSFFYALGKVCFGESKARKRYENESGN